MGLHFQRQRRLRERMPCVRTVLPEQPIGTQHAFVC